MNMPNDIFQSRQYRLNRILLSLLGQWPFQKERNRRCIFITVSFVAFINFVAQVIAFVNLRNDINVLVACISSLIVHTDCIIKVVNLYWNMDKIKMFFEHMQKDWQLWTIKSEYKILQKFAEYGRRITIVYACGMYVFCLLFSLLEIIPKISGKNLTSPYPTRPVGFAYHVEYYIDLEKYYYPVLIHTYISAVIRITIYVAKDTCVAILVQHCCTLFSVVRYRLEYIQSSISQDKRLALLEEDDKIYKNFVYCIRKHEQALRFANIMESTFSMAFFWEVGLVILNMSLTSLQVTMVPFTPQLAIRYGSFMGAQLLHLFIPCRLGQQIIDHSDHVYTSVYQGEWYKAPLKSQKLLNIIMLRSTSPCTLSIGKIMVFSLSSFNAIIRAAASYFTVFQSVR